MNRKYTLVLGKIKEQIDEQQEDQLAYRNGRQDRLRQWTTVVTPFQCRRTKVIR